VRWDDLHEMAAADRHPPRRANEARAGAVPSLAVSSPRHQPTRERPSIRSSAARRRQGDPAKRSFRRPSTTTSGSLRLDDVIKAQAVPPRRSSKPTHHRRTELRYPPQPLEVDLLSTASAASSTRRGRDPFRRRPAASSRFSRNNGAVGRLAAHTAAPLLQDYRMLTLACSTPLVRPSLRSRRGAAKGSISAAHGDPPDFNLSSSSASATSSMSSTHSSSRSSRRRTRTRTGIDLIAPPRRPRVDVDLSRHRQPLRNRRWTPHAGASRSAWCDTCITR